MATKYRVKSPFSTFLNSVLMAGGETIPISNTSVTFITTPDAVVEGAGSLTFNVVLSAITTTPDAFEYSFAGYGASPSIPSMFGAPIFSDGVTLDNSGIYIVVPIGILNFSITYTTASVGYFTPDRTVQLTLGGAVSAIGTVQSIAETWTSIPRATGLTIPANFLGQQHHATYASLSPGIVNDGAKAYRTTNYLSHGNSAFWSDIEKSEGVYTTVNIDAVINAHFARGDTIMYNLFSTPPWAAKGPEGSITWSAGISRSVPASPSQLDYLYDAVAGCTVRWICVQSGTSGGTVPNWQSLPKWPSGLLSSGTWRADNGGEYVITLNGHLQSTGFPVNLSTSAMAGIRTVTGVIDANNFTIASASNLGSIAPIIYLCIADGTAIWRQVELPYDPNYHRGGNNPWHIDKATAHIQWMLNRYNADADKKIKIIEVGNEPEFSKTNTMFFNGSAAQLVDMVWYAKQAVLASVDPTVKVIPAGFTYNSNIWATPAIIREYVNATGTLSGKKGWETLTDGISIHRYGNSWVNNVWNSPGIGNTSDPFGYQAIRNIITTAGGSGETVDMYMTEFGITNGGNPVSATYKALDPADRRKLLFLEHSTMALNGIKQCYDYAYDDIYFAAQPDTSGEFLARADFNALLAGTTIESAEYSNGKRLKIRIAGVDHIYEQPSSWVY